MATFESRTLSVSIDCHPGEKYAEDAKLVERDLRTLKSVLEG